jgi:antitoxin component of RelBE/YafQ-DinJ toxin-antitoxin module
VIHSAASAPSCSTASVAACSTRKVPPFTASPLQIRVYYKVHTVYIQHMHGMNMSQLVQVYVNRCAKQGALSIQMHSNHTFRMHSAYSTAFQAYTCAQVTALHTHSIATALKVAVHTNTYTNSEVQYVQVQ